MRQVLIALLALLSACQNPVTMIERTPLFPVPVVYRVWHEELEKCSGVQGDFERINWYVASSIIQGGEPRGGYWTEDRHEITVQIDMIRVEQLIKHEEMHDLLNTDGHPPGFFNGTCGNLLYF